MLGASQESTSAGVWASDYGLLIFQFCFVLFPASFFLFSCQTFYGNIGGGSGERCYFGTRHGKTSYFVPMRKSVGCTSSRTLFTCILILASTVVGIFRRRFYSATTFLGRAQRWLLRDRYETGMKVSVSRTKRARFLRCARFLLLGVVKCPRDHIRLQEMNGLLVCTTSNCRVAPLLFLTSILGCSRTPVLLLLLLTHHLVVGAVSSKLLRKERPAGEAG